MQVAEYQQAPPVFGYPSDASDRTQLAGQNPVQLGKHDATDKERSSSTSPPTGPVTIGSGTVDMTVAPDFVIDPDLLAADPSATLNVQLGAGAPSSQHAGPHIDQARSLSAEVKDAGGLPASRPSPSAALPRLDTSLKRKSPSPPTLGKSWSLADDAAYTQPPSAATESPITPLGAYDSALSSPTGYDFSRNSSQADLLSPRLGSGSGSTDSVDGEYKPAEDDGEGGVPAPKKKKSHARKQPEGHIKRARNAFILFRKHVTDSNLIPPSVEVKHQNISVVAAKMWREAPPDVRKKFQEMARIEKEEHQRKYPGYRYQPVFRRTDIIRRRVRKDPAEDEKVEAVAEALMKGKAGDALETEIKEQMAQRSDASESEAEQPKVGTSRRRRREQGQLSKGAIRAQRAQARAKQMRQNLLGHNLLQVSMYNAQQQQQRQLAAAAQPAMQYAVAESYMPMAYDYDGRPIMDSQGRHAYVQETGHAAHDAYGQSTLYGAGDDPYRLPPIMGYEGQHAGIGGGGGAMPPPGPAWGHEQSHMDHWAGGYGEPQRRLDGPYYHHAAMPEEYALPPLGPGHDYQSAAPFGDNNAIAGPSSHDQPGGVALPEFASSPHLQTARPAELIAGQYAHDVNAHSGSGNGGNSSGNARQTESSRPVAQPWSHGAPETPSGHMVFQDRLFDGALGSAMLGERRDDDGLDAFGEAVQQVHDISAW